MSATATQRRDRRRQAGHAASGFTLVEIMMAISVFTVGALALTSSTFALTRMIGGGSKSNHAAFVAAQGIERLRTKALGPTGCAALANGTDTNGVYVRHWTVTPATHVDRVLLTVKYRWEPRYVRVDTFATSVAC